MCVCVCVYVCVLCCVVLGRLDARRPRSMTAIRIIPRSVLQRAAGLRRRMRTAAEGKRREQGGVGVEGILNPFLVEGRRGRDRDEVGGEGGLIGSAAFG